MRTGKLIATLVGALIALVGMGALIAGSVLLWANATQRDADDFFTSPTYELRSDGYAITAEEVDLGGHPGDWFPSEGDLTFRITATPGGERDLFVGIASEDDLAAYLDGVEHDRVTDVSRDGEVLDLERVAGGAPSTAPADSGVFLTSATGPGTQTLTWDAEAGEWALAVMNADGSGVVDVDITAGVRTDLVLPIAIGLLIAGLVAMGVGAVIIVVATVGGLREAAPAPAAAGSTPAGRYPLVLTAQTEPDVSRALWLVKWILAIPHFIVLALLWSAFVVLTFVAGVAILFTGRYPRGIFDFNVGVMRWSWRVSYYAFGVLGTDRYPRFTLDHDPDYPADLDVAYPEQLSRGLVLVKWWLLAIPHYIVVAVLTGGMTWTSDIGEPGGFEVTYGGGLLGVLVLVAGVILLVSGRYPRGLYDLVVGLQRWVYRVVAYAALMTDEYPPFRLDLGGGEPSTPGPASPDAGGTSGEHRELIGT